MNLRDLGTSSMSVAASFKCFNKFFNKKQWPNSFKPKNEPSRRIYFNLNYYLSNKKADIMFSFECGLSLAIFRLSLNSNQVLIVPNVAKSLWQK